MQTNTTTTSPSEAIATQAAEALARGEDPFGDDETNDSAAAGANDDAAAAEAAAAAAATEQAAATEAAAADTTTAGADAAAAAAAADATTAAKPGADDALDAEALAAVAADDDPPESLEVSAKDFKAERQRIADAEDAVEQKWTKGELSDDDRVRELRKLRDETGDLIREETQAQTLADVNRQNAVRYQAKVLRSLAADSKAAGQLDYSDAKVGSAYDAMLGAVSSDPENAGKNFNQLARLAHDALCAARGVKGAAAASPAPAPAAATAKRAAPPPPPVTLRTLPSASTPNTGGDALEALGNLKGQDYQDAFNNLSPAQKARLLDE